MSAKEVFNDTKEAISERLKNPFLGKLILSWLIVNWKTWYITFFIKEETIKPKTKVQEISEYLSPNNSLDALLIYGLPIFITIALIWWLPYITNEAFKASENFRKKKALTKRKTDNSINSSIEKEVKDLKSDIMNKNEAITKYRLLAIYLNLDIDAILNKNLNNSDHNSFYKKHIKNQKNEERINLLLNSYHKQFNSSSYFNRLTFPDKELLEMNGIIHKKDLSNEYSLTDFGNYLSKKELYSNFGSQFSNFKQLL